MKIRFILSVFFVIAATILVVSIPVSAQVTIGEDDSAISADLTANVTIGGDDAETIVPASDTPDLTASVTIGGDDAEPTAPSVTDSLVGTVTNGGDDDVSNTETPSVPTKIMGSGGGGGGFSGSRIINNNTATIAVTPIQISISAGCPLITSNLLKIGGSNDSADVSRLQSFLKDIEKLDVDVNGTFDAKTESAVKVFQLKYKDEILSPWKATRASGVVYITTSKKINDIACNQPMVLSQSELDIIAAYNPNTTVGATTSSTGPNVQTQPVNPNGVTPTIESGDIIGVGTSSTENVAGVVEAPVLRRFWNFMTGLFR